MRLRSLLRSERGFTLLETMIAMAIMVVAFASIFAIQGNSLRAAEKSKRMNVVGMLAKSAMTQTEIEIMGKPFSEISKESAGTFDPPYEEYSWTREVKEVEFPTLSMGGGEGDQESGTKVIEEQMTRLLASYLKKALREITITVKWSIGPKEQTYSVAMYWIDSEATFDLN